MPVPAAGGGEGLATADATPAWVDDEYERSHGPGAHAGPR